MKNEIENNFKNPLEVDIPNINTWNAIKRLQWVVENIKLLL